MVPCSQFYRALVVKTTLGSVNQRHKGLESVFNLVCDKEGFVRLGRRIPLGLVLLLCAVSLQAGNETEPFTNIPAEQRDALAKRLNTYVDANRERKWEQLYGLVSSVGRDGVTQKDFIFAMESAHGIDFANDPDLLEFRPERAQLNAKGTYLIYGCARARREGMTFNGVAVTLAVPEHGNWFFTGWTFVAVNASCKELEDPKWQPQSPTLFGPMEEVQNFKAKNSPARVDSLH
jgi:hypothetical protein